MINWRDLDISKITNVTLLNDSNHYLRAYEFGILKESGNYAYIVGTPQSLTRLIAHRKGQRSRKHTPLLISEFNSLGKSGASQEAVDQGALAPLNLSMNRIETVLSWPKSWRGSVRLAALRKIDSSLHPDFNHWLGRLQFATFSSHPQAILTDELHSRYWVNWDNSAMMSAKGHLKWLPMDVCVTMEDGSTTVARL